MVLKVKPTRAKVQPREATNNTTSREENIVVEVNVAMSTDVATVTDAAGKTTGKTADQTTMTSPVTAAAGKPHQA